MLDNKKSTSSNACGKHQLACTHDASPKEHSSNAAGETSQVQSFESKGIGKKVSADAPNTAGETNQVQDLQSKGVGRKVSADAPNAAGETNQAWQGFKRQGIGKKAEYLFRLQDMGANVPSFFVIDSCQLSAALQVPFSKLSCARDVRQYILSAKIADETLKKWQTLASQLGSKKFAVRSSSLAEDGLNASCAGQFASFLNVELDGLDEAIKGVYASAYSDGALKYHKETSTFSADLNEAARCFDGSDGQAMAVIVQTMIDPSLAGVAFGANPLTKNSDECVLELVECLGESLVSGEVTPYSFTYSRSLNRISSENSINAHMHMDKAKEIFKTLLDLQEKLGFFADIELAIKDGELFILQARPITTKIYADYSALKNKLEALGELEFYVSRSFVPLVYDTQVLAAQSDFQAKEYGFALPINNALIIMDNEFYKSSETYQSNKTFAFLCQRDPLFFDKLIKKIRDDMKKVAEFSQSLNNATTLSPNLSERSDKFSDSEHASLSPNLGELGNKFSDSGHASLSPNLGELGDKFSGSEDVALTAKISEIREKFGKFREFYRLSYLPMVTRPDEFLTEKLTDYINKSGLGEKKCATLFSLITASVDAGDLLYWTERKDFSAIAKYHAQKEDENDPLLLEMIDKHAKKYGWMKSPLGATTTSFSKSEYLKRLQVNKPRPQNSTHSAAPSELSPSTLEQFSSKASSGRQITSEQLSSKASIGRLSTSEQLSSKASSERALKAISELAAGAVWAADIMKFAHYLREFIHLRTLVSETSDYLFYVFRTTLARDIAKVLAIEPGDICFLKNGEIDDLLKNRALFEGGHQAAKASNSTYKEVTSLESNLEYIIKERKAGYCVVWQNGQVSTYEGEFIEGLYREFFFKDIDDATCLKGRAVSHGKARGRVKIIKSFFDCEKVEKGDILVASMLTPSIVMAMERAAAFITDEGGLTCHAAILAREYSIPCIVGMKNATRRLKDDMLVEVDAFSGTVSIKDSKAEL